MNRRVLSILLVLTAAAVAACGKPKPREVIELELDGKLVELRVDALLSIRGQFRAVCELAESVGERGFERAQTAGRFTVSRNEHRMSAEDGDAVTRTETRLGWGASFTEELRRLGEVTGKPIDAQALSGLGARLDSLRGGWRAAALYESDTATLDKVKSFDRYTYRQVKFTHAWLECVQESSERGALRR